MKKKKSTALYNKKLPAKRKATSSVSSKKTNVSNSKVKLTKQIEAEILYAYNTFWDANLAGNMETFASYLVDDFSIFGSATGEIFLSKEEAVGFYTATADQMKGKAQLRNRKISVQPFDSNSAVIREESDLYVLIENVWTFYGHARISCILQHTSSGWKAVHQHASFPDHRTEEGQQIAVEKIEKENLELREAVKRRTVELEQKNRELEIEASLERVRARAMSMQHSYELSDLIGLIYKELTRLDVVFDRCFIMLFDEQGNAVWWMASPESPGGQKGYFVKYHEHKPHLAYLKGFRQQVERWDYTVAGREKKAWDNFIFSETDLVDFPAQAIESMKVAKSAFLTASFNRFGCLTTGSFAPLETSSFDILLRFSKMFEQTYTRFLDLQKAEAQAREAQIQLALERVRAKTMAMQKSDELREVVATLYEQLQSLDFKHGACTITIMDEASGDMDWWMSGFGHDQYPESYHVKYFNHPCYEAQLSNWRKREKFAAVTLSGKEKKNYDKVLFSQTDFKKLPVETKTIMTQLESVVFSLAYMKYGALTWGPGLIPEESAIILQRFSDVFEQTYTRFLDLQKAEAQAREAQIEAALEKVRSRAMAMQNSDELHLVIGKVFAESINLQISLDSSAIIIYDQDQHDSKWWLVNHEDPNYPAGFQVQHNHYPFSQAMLKAWKQKLESWDYVLGGEEKKIWDSFMYAKTDFALLPENIKEVMLSVEHLYINAAFNTFGCIMLTSLTPFLKEQLEILPRFSNVFEQTYTRFLDLQKAEAQAREAQIEASLERVRSTSLAMHTSQDLSKVVYVVFTELVKLDAQLDRCVILIVNPETFGITWYLTGKEGLLSNNGFLVENNPHPSHRAYLEGWKTKRKKWRYLLSGEEKKSCDAYFFSQTQLANLPDFIKADMRAVEAIHLTISSDDFGCLIASSISPLSDAHSGIVDRFSSVFSQTYTRFLDLQKAEAQAREAQIEAALEKVRSSSLAMHHSSDLEKVAGSMFGRFSELGLSYDGALIFTFDKVKRSIKLWIGTKHLSAASLIDIPYDSHIETNLIIHDLWHAIESGNDIINQSYSDESKNAYFKHVASYNDSKIPQPVQQIQQEADSWTLHLVAEKNSMVGFDSWSGQQIKEDEFKILKRFAKVFEQAYTRFLDLRKAEAQAREARIETALERVRSRTMAMQYSKDLTEVAKLLFHQVQALGVPAWSCGFNIWEQSENCFTGWMSSQGILQPPFKIPLSDIAPFNRFYESRQKGELFYVDEMGGDTLVAQYQYMRSLPGFGDILDNFLKSGFTLPTFQINHVVNFLQGNLIFITSENVPEAHDIFKRFAKVFEQTYTRFLDLQKAEAQAREAQIEVALEKVRSTSLAMHKAEELRNVVAVVFQKLKELGLSFDVAGIQLFTEHSKDIVQWVAAPDLLATPILAYLPFVEKDVLESEVLKDFWEAKEMGKSSFNKNYSFVEKNKFFEYAARYNDFNTIPEDVREFQLNAPRYMLTLVTEKRSALWVDSYSGQTIPDEGFDILKRFARVFEQAYVRFLDLQKAEAQAREAQIEAALEKIRSRSLAMHHSDELREVIAVFFEKLNELKVLLGTVGITLLDHKSRDIFCWVGNSIQEPQLVFVPYSEDKNLDETFLKDTWVGMTEKKEIINKLYTKEQKDRYFEHLFYNNDLTTIPESAREVIRNIDSEICCFFPYNNFGLFADSWDGRYYTEADISVLRRAGKVFEQAYIRFLDIQKAEAQAREAQIEAALEKVRSTSLAIHQSQELEKVVVVLFEKLMELDVLFDSAFIYFFDKPQKNIEAWVATKQLAHPLKVYMPYEEEMVNNPIIADLWHSFENGQDGLNKCYKGKEKDDYYRYEARHNKSVIPEDITNFCIQAESWTTSFAAEKNSIMGFDSWSGQQIKEDQFKILKRFAKVFEQAYVRFLDLQKSEAQAREAQIESALERVRARTMGMQKSEDLRKVVKTLYAQLKELGFQWGAASITIMDKDSGDIDWWMEGFGDGYDLPEKYRVPYFDHSGHNEQLDHWKNGKAFAVIAISGAEKKAYDNYYFFQTDFAMAPKESKNLMMRQEAVLFSMAYMQYGAICWSPTPLTDEQAKILQRFAKVFEQSYTRFIDLQKAEAQAREAQIEAALERVRSRTMAMHNSSELIATAEVIFEQLKQLGAESLGVAFAICESDNIMVKKWTNIGIFSIPYTDEEGEQKMYEAWKNQKELHEEIYEGERIQRYYELFLKFPAFKEGFDKHLASGYILPSWQKNHAAIFKYGYLLFITTKPFEETNIFVRFAKVFEQTYTRFLDLQKAEAQAREAYIETALERVRSRTMAMQRSEELADAASLLFKQVIDIKVNAFASVFHIWQPDGISTICWANGADGLQPALRVPHTEEPFHNQIFDAWKRGEDFFVMETAGKELDAAYQFLFKQIGGKEVIDGIEDSGFPIPKNQVTHCVFFLQGYIMFNTYERAPEAHEIFKRFGKVFEQTYTRFLDLQKAEASTRESQIQLALERVRAKTMAMQHSGELREIAAAVHDQLLSLGFTSGFCSIVIMDSITGDMTWWMFFPGKEYPESYHMPFCEHPFYLAQLNHWKQGEKYSAVEASGEEKKSYDKHVFSQTEFVKIPIETQQFMMSFEKIIFSNAYMKHGSISWGVEPIDDEHAAVLQRFAGVFEQCYTRFLDLQKAEAQAKEAIKRSSVDRVRAEIASMRTTHDLERITPLIWNELISIGVPFIRCGVFIMDDAQEQIHTFLSTPDGKAIGAFHLPYTSTNLSDIVQHWRDKKIYKTHWGENEYVLLADELIKQNAIASRVQFLSSVPTEGIFVNYVPFLQGMLYVGNTSLLSEDDLKLVQALADSFSTAYARYEDFTKLELAKKQIENTLTDLKQTQQLLVQSEKMASLGELTAGIAHEIQNPLNFVNNFSEVSTELIDEMLAELATGNLELVTDISKDLRDNLTKINHHGKRAGDIVKGMLQHSRSSSATLESTDINALADEYLRLAYHGLRAKDKSFNAKFETAFDVSIGKVNVIPQDMGRVILNLITNAFYVVNEKSKQGIAGYEPTVSVSTKKEGNKVLISVNDNGNGIPQKILDKIFQPFFTTKPTGQGTGLGLSLSYDIVKAHGGELRVETKEGEGSEFIIQISK
jgi:signal transduction histidine kinase